MSPSSDFEPFARYWLTSPNWLGHWDHLFPTRWPAPIPPGPDATGVVRIEEYDEGDAHVIRAEMPGLDPEADITVEVSHDLLTVTATREHRSETDDDGRGRMLRSEFSYGTFRRTVRLPSGSTADDVTASYEAGVLEVRIARHHDDGAAAVSIPVRSRLAKGPEQGPD